MLLESPKNSYRINEKTTTYITRKYNAKISNSLKRDLLEIGALYDYIEDYKKYADMGDSCGINTIN